MAIDATDQRLAEEAVSEDDLPEWIKIVNSKQGDGSGLAGLDRIVNAFLDESDEGEVSSVNATKQELKANLDIASAAGQPVSDSWVNRHLKSAIDHKIVFMLPRGEGASRRFPDVFRLTAAAERKYGPHLPPNCRR